MFQPWSNLSAYISECTRGFIGREWVFARIDRWLADPDAPRYFLIVGEPGIGKTAIAARLTQIRDLAAVHFCVAHQADTIDPRSFVRSLSHQLARIDGFAKGVLEGNDVRLEARQTVREVYGQAINVEIENLIVHAPSAEGAFVQTVIEPLKALCNSGFDRQLVILVDALDEAAQFTDRENIVHLLANARGLPPQVRFVLTSRPEGFALRHFEQLQTSYSYLVLDAGQEANMKDVQEYIRRQLAVSESLRALLVAQEMPAEAFVQQVAQVSGGNFLYVVWLLRAMTESTQGFDALKALPQGLDGMYREFLRAHRVGNDVGQWRDRYRPLFGVLAAAQAPLTVEQLVHFTRLGRQEVDDLIFDMQPFLDPPLAQQGQYQLFHKSLAGFLSSRRQAQ